MYKSIHSQEILKTSYWMVKTVTVCHIQPDFAEYLDTGEGEEFYINLDESLNHIKEYRVKCREDPMFQELSHNLYGTELDGKRFRFCTKECDYADIVSDRWTCIDVNDQSSTLYALGDAEGNIRVFNSFPTLQREILSAHLDEITTLRFFPSGQVLLSGSTDMRLKIWSLVDGTNPRTFEGHKAQITDTCMIERGRNFVSSSLDGTLKLWETGSGLAVHTFHRKENALDGVNTMNLISENTKERDALSHNLEFGTAGKRILAGHESGVITLHDLFTKKQTLQLPSTFMCSCNTLTRNPSNNDQFYAGYQNGGLAQWDLRKPELPLDKAYINEGIPINQLYYHSDGLYVSSGVDTALKLDLDEKKGTMDCENPTFLVVNDSQVAQFAAAPHCGGVIAVGNWGLCSSYNC